MFETKSQCHIKSPKIRLLFDFGEPVCYYVSVLKNYKKLNWHKADSVIGSKFGGGRAEA